ncbi:MAG TPA: type IV pili methyl-accepting chemotaxis transducer N-terminal domain-containing protein, partial [Anaerolineales bacterium]|nr:type IV pili methyl-accepting chemotaxis transducer N-terminal domain-containing protein [Anaerolineales bacterium]
MTIRRLRLIAFLGFLLLATASVAVTLWSLRAQQDDALVINLAGRQRMLIQQMALETLGVQIGVNSVYGQTLHETADDFEQTLNALAFGGEAPYTEGTTITLPATPAYATEILAQLELVRATWGEMHPPIHVVLQNDPQSAAFAEAATTVDRLSPVLLAQMDKAVQLYEAEARRKVAFVRAIQLGFLATAAAMLIVAIFITERWLLAPIARLEAAARGIGEGDMATPVSVAGLGEVDRLARSLDEMRRRLSASAEAQTALLGLSRGLLAARDEQAVAECAVEIAASALHTDFSALVLPDAEGRLLTRAVRGWPADFAGHFELAQGDASQTGY